MLKVCPLCGASYVGGANPPRYCTAESEPGVRCGTRLMLLAPAGDNCLLCQNTGEVTIEDPTHPDKRYTQNCPRQHVKP